jgi:hypothetical protein
MKSEEWKSYRTRFLVNAKQLNSPLSFVDHLGRQHRGRKGDYLVESSDGVISIAPRRIFEDIYVPMLQPQASENPEAVGETQRKIPRTTARRTMTSDREISEPEIDLRNFEALEIQEISLGKCSTGRQPMNGTGEVGPDQTARKLPQPCRDRRSSSPRLGLM